MGKTSDRERDQIRGVRNVVAPVIGGGPLAPIARRLHQAAIRNGREIGRHGGDHFGRSALVGGIVAWKPVTRVFVFALGPHLGGAFGVRAIRLDEIKAHLRFRYGVFDHDRDRIVLLRGSRRGEREFSVFIECKRRARRSRSRV